MAREPGKPVTAADLIEGAAILIRVATGLEAIIERTKGAHVKLSKDSLGHMAAMFRQSAHVVDHLVTSVERGESFNERLPR